MSPARARSLRGRLLWLLLAAIVLTAVVQAAIVYHAARAEADRIFDHHMEQMALSLRSGLTSAGPPEEIPDEENFEFIVQVWTADGLRVFESARRAALPQRAVLGFSDVRARGTTYRVYSLQTRTQVIQVAQDMAARSAMARSLAFRTITPTLVMAPLLMLVAWWAVGSSLAPVSRVRRQVAERQPDDLVEVSDADLPDEIRPLVRELNLLFSRVRHAFEAQKNFVADAAHELRSPLAALKLQAQGLRRAQDGAARDTALARLDAGIERATRLVEQLLVLARQQANATSASPTPVVVADVAREAVAEAAAAATAAGVDLGLAHADDGTIDGHAEPLRILARNLLENAIKFTPRGGVVDVGVRRAADAIELVVEDSGPGIPDDERVRVLDRFHRVAGTETTGSGLGLAIVKSIAELHGAGVALDRSERLGGLRVVVRFPPSR